MRNIKGESSFWANKQHIFADRLEWQDDYFAVSVSESQIEKVRRYILFQEQHHRKKNYEQEAAEFLNIYGWNKIHDKDEFN